MKKVVSIFVFLLILISCSSDDDFDVNEIELNTINFKVNGEEFVDVFRYSNVSEMSVSEGEYFFSVGGSSQGAEENFGFSIEILGSEALKTYEISGESYPTPSLNCSWDNKNYLSNFGGSEVNSTVTITEFDTEKETVRGTFQGVLQAEDGSQITITDGVFYVDF